MSILSAEGFCDEECECGKTIGTEEAMMQACSEPFNGIIHQCECGKEYSIDIGFRVTPLED
jgi:hypothetical protein